MSIIENIKEWFTSETARNKNSAVLAGILFFTGWWILIDVLSVYPGQVNAGQIIIGVFGSISFFMVNSVKNSHLSEDNVSLARARAAKIWLLIGFVMGFSSIMAAVFVLIEDLTSNTAKQENWPGVAVLIQNVFIFIANLVYKFGRNEEDWSY